MSHFGKKVIPDATLYKRKEKKKREKDKSRRETFRRAGKLFFQKKQQPKTREEGVWFMKTNSQQTRKRENTHGLTARDWHLMNRAVRNVAFFLCSPGLETHIFHCVVSETISYHNKFEEKTRLSYLLRGREVHWIPPLHVDRTCVYRALRRLQKNGLITVTYVEKSPFILVRVEVPTILRFCRCINYDHGHGVERQKIRAIFDRVCKIWDKHDWPRTSLTLKPEFKEHFKLDDLEVIDPIENEQMDKMVALVELLERLCEEEGATPAKKMMPTGNWIGSTLGAYWQFQQYCERNKLDTDQELRKRVRTWKEFVLSKPTRIDDSPIGKLQTTVRPSDLFTYATAQQYWLDNGKSHPSKYNVRITEREIEDDGFERSSTEFELEADSDPEVPGFSDCNFETVEV
jgi:hypothetical protein